VAEPFDRVEQGQLRAGVRDLAADDEPCPFRVGGVRYQAGDLGDLRAVTEVTLGADGRHPLADAVKRASIRKSCTTAMWTGLRPDRMHRGDQMMDGRCVCFIRPCRRHAGCPVVGLVQDGGC
jgi:hypothetical protein